MATPSAGSGLLFNSTASTSGVVTAPVAVKQMMMTSFQTKSDGTQTLTVDVQVSNVPALRDNFAGQIRDDSFASADWVTVSTATMSAAVASRMDVVAYTTHRVARLRLTSGASTPTVKVWVAAQGWE